MNLLTGPFCLSDQVIAFYFQYLESEKYKEFSQELLFVSPQVTQLIKLSNSNECRSLLEHLNPSRKKLIFFAVNDNETHEAGGNHWSLLVYSRQRNEFYNFDSMDEFNISPTERLVKTLQKGLRRYSAKLYQHECAQQTNLMDCGIHVLCNAEIVCDHFFRVGVVKNTPVVNISDKRIEILELIARLGGKIKIVEQTFNTSVECQPKSALQSYAQCSRSSVIKSSKSNWGTGRSYFFTNDDQTQNCSKFHWNKCEKSLSYFQYEAPLFLFPFPSSDVSEMQVYACFKWNLIFFTTKVRFLVIDKRDRGGGDEGDWLKHLLLLSSSSERSFSQAFVF